MRSISKQQYFIVKVPWITTDGHQCRGWIFKKVFCQCRHIGQSIRECLLKKCNDLFFSIQTFERSLDTEEKVVAFFEKTFPDALANMPTLTKDFFENPTSTLVTIRCNQKMQRP